MSWEILTTEDILSQFTIAEAASLRTLQGSGSGSGFPFTNLDVITVNVIDEVRGYINAGNYSLDVDPRKIPIALFDDAIAIGRWRILIAVPMLKQLQTEERKLAYIDALKKLLLISEGKFDIDQPDPLAIPKTGMWNSENKLIMRTHPVPRLATQFTPQINTYGNPVIAPSDTTNTQTSGLLSIGTSYTIILYITGDDFTNVGGTNATRTSFVATGTTPTDWTNGSQLQS